MDIGLMGTGYLTPFVMTNAESFVSRFVARTAFDILLVPTSTANNIKCRCQFSNYCHGSVADLSNVCAKESNSSRQRQQL